MLRGHLPADPTVVVATQARLMEARRPDWQRDQVHATRRSYRLTVIPIERGGRSRSATTAKDRGGIFAADFQRFTQARPALVCRRRAGTWVSIVKHVVELHDGTISGCQRRQGPRATFTIVIRWRKMRRACRDAQLDGRREMSPDVASNQLQLSPFFFHTFM